jgi:hypothetical protein
MKVIDVLEHVDNFKPNAFDRGMLINSIDKVESTICTEIFKQSEYQHITVDETSRELKAPSPYDRIYEEYLEAIIDKYNCDMDAYSMSSRTFNGTMDELKLYVTRENLEEQQLKVSRFKNYF